MRNIAPILLFFVIFFFTTNEVMTKSSFNSQIPNGSVNSCATCHTSNTNYGLNPFGKAINTGYLSSGKVTWKPALAALDSDGDGFTNGEELQDPQGLWTIGSSQPGDAGKVSNPGLKSSIPTSISDEQVLSTYTIFPNPASDYISLSFDRYSPNQSESPTKKIQIFDVQGIEVIAESAYEVAGIYRINIKNLSNGVYFIILDNMVVRFVKM